MAGCAAEAAPERRSRLLVVEDDEDVQHLVRLVMEGVGWEVAVAGSVGAAVAALASVRPDVIALDLTLPDGAGLDLLDVLRREGLVSSIPIVVLSGDHQGTTAAHALLAGAQDFITKPFEPVELRARLTAARRVASVIADLHEAREQLTHQSLHDGLTGLANRHLVIDQLRRALARDQRHRQGLVVLFLDLDGLKAANDEHGHEAGDELLVQVAARLREEVRAGDTAGRIGGDEFVVVATEVPSATAAKELAERMRRRLADPYVLEVLGGATVACTVSIGVCRPRRGDDEHAVLRCADEAMYRAKQLGKDRFVLYRPV